MLRDDIAQCDREISEAERRLRANEPGEDGLLMWMADWEAEKRLLMGDKPCFTACSTAQVESEDGK